MRTPEEDAEYAALRTAILNRVKPVRLMPCDGECGTLVDATVYEKRRSEWAHLKYERFATDDDMPVMTCGQEGCVNKARAEMVSNRAIREGMSGVVERVGVEVKECGWCKKPVAVDELGRPKAYCGLECAVEAHR